MWKPSISYAIPEIPANPTGNAARLKDINFLIESTKSCNDFSIGAILRSAEIREQVFAKERHRFLYTECPWSMRCSFVYGYSRPDLRKKF